MVRQFRRRYGLKQEALASLVGVRQPTIVRWEKGEGEPALYRQAEILRAMRKYAELNSVGVVPALPVATEPLALPATIRAMVRVQPIASLLDPSFRMVEASSFIREGFKERQEDAIGYRVDRLFDDNSSMIAREWSRELLRPGSDLLAVSYDDLSVLIDGRHLRRTWTAIEVDGKRFIMNADAPTGETLSDLPPLNVSLLTRDDL